MSPVIRSTALLRTSCTLASEAPADFSTDAGQQSPSRGTSSSRSPSAPSCSITSLSFSGGRMCDGLAVRPSSSRSFAAALAVGEAAASSRVRSTGDSHTGAFIIRLVTWSDPFLPTAVASRRALMLSALPTTDSSEGSLKVRPSGRPTMHGNRSSQPGVKASSHGRWHAKGTSPLSALPRASNVYWGSCPATRCQPASPPPPPPLPPPPPNFLACASVKATAALMRRSLDSVPRAHR